MNKKKNINFLWKLRRKMKNTLNIEAPTIFVCCCPGHKNIEQKTAQTYSSLSLSLTNTQSTDKYKYKLVSSIGHLISILHLPCRFTIFFFEKNFTSMHITVGNWWSFTVVFGFFFLTRKGVDKFNWHFFYNKLAMYITIYRNVMH